MQWQAQCSQQGDPTHRSPRIRSNWPRSKIPLDPGSDLRRSLIIDRIAGIREIDASSRELYKVSHRPHLLLPACPPRYIVTMSRVHFRRYGGGRDRESIRDYRSPFSSLPPPLVITINPRTSRRKVGNTPTNKP